MSSTRKVITFSVDSEEQKEWINKIAAEKGYGNASTLARVAIAQMFSRMKVSFEPPETFLDRER